MKVVVALIATGFFVWGCSRNSPTQSPASPTATKDPHAAVVESLKKWIAVKSFRQRFTTTSDGATTNGTMEFVAPDRVHVMMEIAGEIFESITIGRTEYSKDTDGKWVKTVIETGITPTAGARLFTDPKQIASLASDIGEVRSTGSEFVEGIATNVYEFKHKLGNSSTIYQSRLWIGAIDGLPRKFQTTYDEILEGARRKVESSGTYFDYNAAINISPPIQ